MVQLPSALDVKNLVGKLNIYRDTYYNDNVSLVSDAEYDKLYDKLLELEKETGIIISNSPTQSVGYIVKSELGKVIHDIPMLSLDKTKDINKILSFMQDKDLIASLKLDGLAIKLKYDKGRLIQGSTRGNGEEGEDITHNVHTFVGVPLTIPYNDYIEITGECIIHYDSFNKINESIINSDDKYKTPRNLVSGSVRQLNSEICKSRNVYFYAYNISKDDGDIIYNKTEELNKLITLGFNYVMSIPPCNSNYIEIESIINDLKQSAKETSTPIDGVVFTYNDKAYGESLGVTNNY